jgi:GntR family transcriptional regulator
VISWRQRLFGARWRVNSGSAVPPHVQIEEQLAERIAARELEAGSRLPSERELARGLGVSRVAVRRALTGLATRGLVERAAGRGAVVAARKLDHDLSAVTGFSDWLERQGLHAASVVRETVELEASWAVAAALQIAPGAPVVRIRRLRLAGETPFVLEDAWLPGELFPGLAGRDLGGSLYRLMRDEYGHAPVRGVERLEPALAGKHEARALDVPERAALMMVERTVYAADGTPLAFSRERHRGDRARWVMKVSDNGAD